MSKNVTLSDEAYATLMKRKRKDESFSDAIKRLTSATIETFGDLEKHLDNLKGPLDVDFSALERIGKRKLKRNSVG